MSRFFFCLFFSFDGLGEEERFPASVFVELRRDKAAPSLFSSSRGLCEEERVPASVFVELRRDKAGASRSISRLTACADAVLFFFYEGLCEEERVPALAPRGQSRALPPAPMCSCTKVHSHLLLVAKRDLDSRCIQRW